MVKSPLFCLHHWHTDMMYIQSVPHVSWPCLQVQQCCKPHWLSSVIHTHYYFTSSGTTALTAPVSPALIREKAPSQLTVVYLYNLPSHAASRYRNTGPNTYTVYDYSQPYIQHVWHVQVSGYHTATHEITIKDKWKKESNLVMSPQKPVPCKWF